MDLDFPIPDLSNLYWNEFGYKLDDTESLLMDQRITPINTGFLISSKDIKWPVNSIFDSLGLEIYTSRIFVTNPNSELIIHRDCIGGERTLREWAINIPIMNCDNSVNEWFSDEDNDFGEEQYIKEGSALIPDSLDKQYVVTESCPLNKIKLIRTDIMHRSNNIGNNKRRVVLSLRGAPSITYNEVKTRYRNII